MSMGKEMEADGMIFSREPQRPAVKDATDRHGEQHGIEHGNSGRGAGGTGTHGMHRVRARIAAILVGAGAALAMLLSPALALAAEATGNVVSDRTPLTGMDMLSVVGLMAVMVAVGACIILHRTHSDNSSNIK
ncbi:hypothetical protein [Bifidobacterium vansinderenii]|uniref:Uncharacterized protein n=1 Tax=Bifidobacterium vansinderenii TaxID=1984871 RepID=A0A229VVU2_9BIFI|nr:hypothetical protein [Bifidobacterium vansinderenii]OXM99747.1 hypothetical protein Tam10B_2025 [Bifidobacterium vansinderenii]